jgi:hypothetical protein
MSAWNSVTRDDLNAWADVDGPRELPILIRRLILETDRSVESIDFPGGTGVQLGGHDGFVRSLEGNAFVPKGSSVWELSVNKNALSKVEGDFAKRISVPDLTPPSDAVYVQVIGRAWRDAATWAAAKSSGGFWKKVHGYNVDRIATWLEQAPATRLWFLERTGRAVTGIVTAETWWETWSTRTTPAFTSELVLARGENTAKGILEMILQTGIVTIAGPVGVDELIACVVAVATANPTPARPVLIVKDQVALERLLVELSPLVLVVENQSLAGAVPADTKHTVVVPLPMAERGSVVIGKLNSSECVPILQSVGASDPDNNARLGRRSLVALRRRLARNLASQPDWASQPPSRTIRATTLLTSWDDANEADRTVVSLLTGKPYLESREELLQLTYGSDPMMLVSGTRWHLVSPLDTFLVLGKYLLADELRAFSQSAIEVLSEADPLAGLAGVERIVAQFQGNERRHSRTLRQGMADGLARLGSLEGPVAHSGSAASGWSKFAVRQLTDSANNDLSGGQWTVLSDVLSPLMEAAPDELLEALRQGAKGDRPVLQTIYRDAGSDSFFGSSANHAYFQWALERVAWSETYLLRSCEILARLTQIDPGGRYGNRAPASLANIHCLWYSGTSATKESRLAVIDYLRRSFPFEAWALMLTLLDRPGGLLADATPEYRDWAPAQRLHVTQSEFEVMSLAISERILEDAGSNPNRWGALLKRTNNFPEGFRHKVFTAFGNVTFDLEDRDTVALWGILRKIVADHREYADADWALPEAELAHLELALALLVPVDLIDRYTWLFADHVELGNIRVRDGYEAYEIELSKQRAAATKMIFEAEGLIGIERLVENCDRPVIVGSSLSTALGDELLDQMLLKAGSGGALSAVADSFLSKRAWSEGTEWTKSVLSKSTELTPSLRAQLLHDTVDFNAVLLQLGQETQEVIDDYWKRFSWQGLGHDFLHALTAARSLLEIGRWETALKVLISYDHPDGIEQAGELTAQALELAVEGDQISEPSSRLSSWDLDMAMKMLDVSKDTIGIHRVARIQWFFLGALRDGDGSSTLQQVLASDPVLFADLVTRTYRPASESEAGEEVDSGNVTDSDSETAGRPEGSDASAFRLLSSWTVPPGVLADGSFDIELLRDWYDHATEILDANGRGQAGRNQIGEVLSFLVTTGESWPGIEALDLIEELDDVQINAGIRMRLFNRRGFASRGLESGGVQEQEIARDYRERADRVAVSHPRAAVLFEGLADEFEAYARQVDLSAERFRLGIEQ